ncbi:OmpA family protein [Formosa maritima]|uniref:OmpA family protein n=1 Tax=Formosa maritima TaxID=2592046 RepID=A0A5D0GMN7_9FLAO|nr:OmpA family protein [Formosa maritima]TYA60161.1 OmpA family protein [Formosa maritima]
MRTIYILFFNFIICHSQNLVLNPSFEDSKYCSELLGNFDNNVLGWSIPNFGSTDYFHSCSEAVGFVNFFGNQKPMTGEAYAGIYVMAPEDYREYIQGEFTETLIKDKKYTVSFYLSLAENSSHAIKDLGVLFLNESLNNQIDKTIDINEVLIEVEKSHFILIHSIEYYIEKEQWEKVTFEYVANGFEQFFIIGNFDKNKKVTSIKIQESKNPDAAYYYIDDISVTSFEIENPKPVSIIGIEENQQIERNKVYTLKNVLFDFDKSDLLESSKKELNQLYNYLECHKNLKIEIFGHTDQVGTQERNDELSLLRAKTVALYLISKGLKPERITAQGFGNRFPITTNNTEEGRALNRRVAFKLTKN